MAGVAGRAATNEKRVAKQLAAMRPLLSTEREAEAHDVLLATSIEALVDGPNVSMSSSAAAKKTLARDRGAPTALERTLDVAAEGVTFSSSPQLDGSTSWSIAADISTGRVAGLDLTRARPLAAAFGCDRRAMIDVPGRLNRNVRAARGATRDAR